VQHPFVDQLVAWMLKNASSIAQSEVRISVAASVPLSTIDCGSSALLPAKVAASSVLIVEKLTNNVSDIEDERMQGSEGFEWDEAKDDSGEGDEDDILSDENPTIPTTLVEKCAAVCSSVVPAIPPADVDFPCDGHDFLSFFSMLASHVPDLPSCLQSL
jgi:hypothetical protein